MHTGVCKHTYIKTRDFQITTLFLQEWWQTESSSCTYNIYQLSSYTYYTPAVGSKLLGGCSKLRRRMAWSEVYTNTISAYEYTYEVHIYKKTISHTRIACGAGLLAVICIKMQYQHMNTRRSAHMSEYIYRYTRTHVCIFILTQKLKSMKMENRCMYMKRRPFKQLCQLKTKDINIRKLVLEMRELI